MDILMDKLMGCNVHFDGQICRWDVTCGWTIDGQIDGMRHVDGQLMNNLMDKYVDDEGIDGQIDGTRCIF